MRLETVPHRNRRRHERVAAVSPATLITHSEIGGMVGYSSYTLDISERGARLRTNTIALSPVQTVVILLPGEAPRCAVRSRVVWIGEAGPGQEREAGLEFYNPTPTTCWGYATERQGFNAAKFLGHLLNPIKPGQPSRADRLTGTNSELAETDQPLVKDPYPPKLPLRILIADDHQIIREGLKIILERQGFKIVGEASDGQQAVARAIEHKPDVAVLDLAMPFKNGIEAAKEILQGVPKTRTILLSVHREDYYVREALRAGIRGYVWKSRSSGELIQAIYEVSRGMTYLSSGISPEIIREISA